MAVQTSSGVTPVQPYLVANRTYRGIGADWFNAGNISAEDFNRSQMASYVDYLRDLQQMNLANDFTASQNALDRQFNAQQATLSYQRNAAEAQKDRDFQQYNADTYYQRTMADMQAAGLNPILAYQLNGASTPSGAFASSTPATASSSRGSASPSRSARRDYKGTVADTSSLVGLLYSAASLASGLYTSGADRAARSVMNESSNAARIASAQIQANSHRRK